VHLVGFIIGIYHDALSPERQFIMMHGHLNIKVAKLSNKKRQERSATNRMFRTELC